MINFVCLVGNLVADPDIRATQHGKKVAKMRIAVNQYWNNQMGERAGKTHFFNLTAWDKKAEFCERFLRKGMKIAIQGTLDYQEWRNQDGQFRSRVEVRIRDIDIMTPRTPDASSPAPSYRPDPVEPAQDYSAPGFESPESGGGYPPPVAGYDEDNIMKDDDIPF